ncbi:hypothetical protein SODALDRAFT_338349 [Sodiomyces alkalinus F11]|uniref:Aminoglycoside phosphotransferase domain-containing protein n=1 Tax=Sodiomyces alkalinus (strain CBS 110278 / VKM F-3762 / F11) TaxID=1314773 RepID=A0A3N2Q1L1_SODAK|nr:hypothetical protein SODALDRAFT_338349 [Sodiomyces alkalinus F11]ROT40647.1 hypothetical protein SODALDRAFT_338349 [Sodiomyces alkalinus F11]
MAYSPPVIFAFGQDHDATHQYPLTPEQRESTRQTFIDSVDQDAICALASRHNDMKPCRILDSASGSFNVCFFVQFLDDHTRWVVRVPVEPVIYDVWAKLQSEVATMANSNGMSRYIQNKTKIPLPRIHAYGRGESLIRDSPTTQAYLILDFVDGRSIDLQALSEDTPQRRKHFFSQFIEIMAQLRQLEFNATGSLMPDHGGRPEPVVGGALSIPINELQIDLGRTGKASSPAFTSATSFALQQHHLMSEIYRLPTSELSEETAQLQVFALHYLRKRIPELIASEWDSGPFILTHSDLRSSNIIVDHDLNIQCIIDWEWAYTVPRQFFIPPSWITGQGLDYLTQKQCYETFLEFREVLREKASSSDLYRQLADDWDSDLPKTLILPLAHILLHPSDLIHVYYRSMFPQLFHEPRAEVVARFFHDTGKNKTLVAEVQQRMADSERYTQYLKDNGLFVPDEETRKAREWLKKAQELNDKLGLGIM